jgi:hypothetical protein
VDWGNDKERSDFLREEAAVYLLERAQEEAVMENTAQAHLDNYEEQCGECGRWVDEDGLVPYQGQSLCPSCRRGYILDDFEKLAGEINPAFSRDVWKAAEALISAMKKEAGE